MKPQSQAEFDVAVIGAGVGGASTALALARRGARVALFESGAAGRHKVCGEFLSPESRGVWARLGVLDRLMEAGACEITGSRVLLSHRVGRSMALPTPGLSISRRALDQILWQVASEKGVSTQEKTKVERVERTDDGNFLVHSAAGAHRARFVVAATGRNARLNIAAPDADELPHSAQTNKTTHRFMGIKTHLVSADVPHGEVQLYPFKGGYCGLVRIEENLVNACLLIDYASAKGRAPSEIWQSARGQNRALAAATRYAHASMAWLATANVSFGIQTPSQASILRVGDAAGYIHPLAGDGMAMAAQSGELAAHVIIQAERHGSTPYEASAHYCREWHHAFDQRLRWASWLQPLVTTPWLSTPALAALDVLPSVANLAVRRTRGDLPPLAHFS